MSTSVAGPPVLTVRDLRVGYRTRGRTVEVVRGVSFTVLRGQVVALVGESGSGKSTTANAVIGLLPEGGAVTGGSILLGEQDLTGWSDRRLRTVRGSRIGLVPQDPTVSLNPTHRIGYQIAEVLHVHRRATRAAARLEAVEILRRAGLDDPEHRARQYPHELSGGMRQRVLIGIALACHPELLIADEPTSALDVTVQRTVLDHLQQLTTDEGTATLFVTHDLGVAADRAQHVLVMKDGLIVEQGPVADVLRAPEHPYTQALVSAAPSLSSRRLVATRPATGLATASGRAVAPERVTATADAGEPAVRVVDLVKDFVPHGAGRRHVVRAVDQVSFEVPQGSTFALVGESGSGKSTVARTVARFTDPTSGGVELFGQDVLALRGEALRRLRARVQLVYQNPYASLNPRFTIEQTLVDPLRAFRLGSRAERRERARELLHQVALDDRFLERRPVELSGGQRQRVAIARALSLEPRLLVLDEPVSALDVSVQAQILQLLVDLQARLGLTYVFISHDLAVVRQVADTVGVMHRGRLVEVGAADDVMRRPRSTYTADLLGAIPGHAVT